MKSFIDRNKSKHRRQSDQEIESRRSSGPTGQLVDKRSEALAQRTMTEAIETGPRQTAQRRQIDELRGESPKSQANSEISRRNSPVSKHKEPSEGRYDRRTAQRADELQPNRTGLPDDLKVGIESLSGYSMDDVKVHFNSAKPARFKAHAYAKGTDIHLASGQDKHLPHEAWHIVQQRQGRVRPTGQIQSGTPVNDDSQLEQEADLMGARAIRPLSIRPKTDKTKNQTVISDSHSINQLQVMQMVRYVRRSTGEIDQVDDGYSPQDGEELLGKLEAAAHLGHQKDLERFGKLKDAKDKGPIMDLRPTTDSGSATLSHLNTPYVDKEMRQRRSLKHGVTARFLTPTPPVPEVEDAPKKRQISADQVKKYQAISQEAIENEKMMKDSHYAFYHAQDPRMRVAQDVYKRVYARYHDKELPEDFHFLRFPGPEDEEFKKHKNVQSYFEEDMAEHGMIDDNINPTKTHLTSVNPALHGGLNHAGEETFHYFQIGQGQTELPVAAIMGGFLEKFQLDASGTEALYKKAAALNATKEGSLFQIMVPKEKVDDVAYMAHPHGLPHDDELFDDLHGMGEIRYPQPEGAEKQPGLPPREKMNDEVTRNLVNMREAHQASPVESPDPLAPLPENSPEREQAIKERKKQARIAFLQRRTRELNQRTVERFQQGEYRPSKHLEDFIQDPGQLQHPEGHAQKLRMEQNPEHFGGQGIRSPHELMRIQNRSTYMQARMHFSESTTLNPDSGIHMKRFTTMEPDQEQAYNKMLDEYVGSLFSKK